MIVRMEYAYGVCPKCKGNNHLRYLIHNDGLVHKPYEIKCINCNSYFKIEDIFGSGEETTPKPKTHADRIRTMTDEELADYFSELSCWPNAGREDCRGMANCMDCWLDWLKQEAVSDG